MKIHISLLIILLFLSLGAMAQSGSNMKEEREKELVHKSFMAISQKDYDLTELLADSMFYLNRDTAMHIDIKLSVLTMRTLDTGDVEWGIKKYKEIMEISPYRISTDMNLVAECLYFFDCCFSKIKYNDVLLPFAWDCVALANSTLKFFFDNKFSQMNEVERLSLIEKYSYVYDETFTIYKKYIEKGWLTNDMIRNKLDYTLFWENKTQFINTPLMTCDVIQKQLKSDELAVLFGYVDIGNMFSVDATVISSDTICYIPSTANRGDIYYILDPRELKSFETINESVENIYSYMDGYYFFWQKVFSLFPNAKRVYYAPNGVLGQIAHDALLVSWGDSAVLSEKVELLRLSSMGNMEQKTADKKLHDIVLFGDVNFYNKRVAKTELEQYVSRSIHTRADKLQRLPYSLEEMNRLRRLFDSKRIKSGVYTNREATENAFKKLSGNSPQVIHLSTHAFFLPDAYSKTHFDLSTDRGVMKNDIIQNYNRNCGLFLSASGLLWNSEGDVLPNTDDGILTAEEIAELDLSNTELVVLSACNTGIGRFENYYGVIGLWRAFKKAGVKSILMTLWEVDDRATSEMMVVFYEEWLKTNNLQKAFRTAQSAMRDKYKSPYYWGAFVLLD